MSSEQVLMLEGGLFEKGQCLEARALFDKEGIALHGFEPIDVDGLMLRHEAGRGQAAEMARQEDMSRRAANPSPTGGMPLIATISWSSVRYIELPRETSDLAEVMQIVETSGKTHQYRPVSFREFDTIEARDRRLARLELAFGSVAEFRWAGRSRSLWQRCWPMVAALTLPVGFWLMGDSLALSVEERAGEFGRGGMFVAMIGSVGVLWLFRILAVGAALCFATIQMLMFRDRS
jgi:hypothetical protein